MMKESGSLWSEEKLLTQMEQMQDQIEQLEQDKKNLLEEVSEKETQLSQQEQISSSEISKLQSALQQAQRKLQEQSGQLVRQSEADLVLQENEKLKSENRRLENEKKLCKGEADREVEAGKAMLQKKEDDLREKNRSVEEREAQVKKKEKRADELIRNRQNLINEAVTAAKERISQENARWYGQIINDLRNTFFRKERVLNSKVTLISLYALGLSVILACRSGPYIKAIMNLISQIRTEIILLWTQLCSIADKGAGISKMIPAQFLAVIFRTIIYALVIILGCGIGLSLIIIMIGWIRRLVKKYLKIWQILLWMSMIISLTICFDSQIHWLFGFIR